MENDVLLRQWRKEDCNALAAIANNKKIWLNVRDRFPHPYTIKDALEWIDHTNQQQPLQNLAIIYKSQLAGSIGVTVRDDVYRKSIEIGYFIGEPFWGKGIATIAVAQMLQYIKQRFDVVRVYAEVFETNHASMKVLEKNGFKHEGIRKKAVIKNNVLMDDHVWVKFI
ncbi:GNAT family N-acetyltransferase [Aridibaculum aurantiacum]|uniref:GNAT family N-acetyltransferase n=1 Tax=Aridibaculum aurantiacum TaxID=2810307 RepID=UPI001A956CD7|nr:GNAT family N-acetyltransferase [Aridibaculum aurantiacum]